MMKTSRLFKNRKWILSGIVSVALIFNGCSSEGKADKKSGEYCLTESVHANTTFHLAATQTVYTGIQLTGKVEHNPDKVVHFVSLVGGIVTVTYFTLGDVVTQGQLLAEIRSTELSNMQAEKNSLASQLQVAKRQMESVESMFRDGIASQKELAQARADVEVLNIELDKVNAQMTLFSASTERGVFQIKAPVSGIVVNKSINPGMQIAAESEPLFTISDLSDVWVMLNIYSGDIARVNEDMPVTIRTLAYPDRVYTGRINGLSRVFDSKEHVLKARVTMPNPDKSLMPGMLIDAVAEYDFGSEAVAVPAEALIFDNNQHFLVVYKSKCNLSIRKVDVFAKNNGNAYIRTGVDSDELVITQNQLLIYEQLKPFQSEYL